MAKKRKVSNKHTESSNGPNLDVGSSKKRIRDFEDVADSDDEFHLNRDKVLLDEGPEAKRRRKYEEQEEFLQPSDEEVLGQSDDEEEGEDEGADQRFGQRGIESASEESGAEGEDEDNEFNWGTGKDDVYGADDIETEEQALEEEAEALRLQKKQLESMTAADYGFDEAEWQNGVEDNTLSEQDDRNVVTEVLPQLQIGEDMTPAEKLKLLKSRYPEFELLSKELLAVQEQYIQLEEELRQEENGFDRDDLPNLKTKVRAASAYFGALVMYFTLLSSPAATGDSNTVALSASHLRDHPIMDTLVKCKELWSRAKSLPEDVVPPAYPELEAELDKHVDTADRHTFRRQQNLTQPPTKKSRAQKHAEAAQAAVEARKAERMQRMEADLANLDALVVHSRKRRPEKSSHATHQDADDGEEAPLTAQEAAEKAQRKKSLRFYTSQIAQKANKRGTASRNAGGDDDIPHRERLRDRQARLNAEAEKRGRKVVDERAELGGESDEEDARQIQEMKAGAQDEDYYDLVAARTAKKKADKAAFVDAQKQAALQGGRVVPEESIGPDGKRKITYAIEKNKGLTPHRKKEVRNPRVKKRKKFDASKKKLASMKPVYKGGEGRGGYGGELTGIKKGLVKSTKL